MENWQEEIGLQEAKGHIAFLQESLSTLSSMSGELTAQIDSLKRQLAAAQDERDAAVSAKKQTDEAVEALHSELTTRTRAVTASTAWQAKLPSLAQFGQSLARLPGYKALAADAAIHAGRLPAVTAAFQDLASVYGIGATYEQRLYNAGVGTYWELSHLSDDDLVSMLKLGDLQQNVIDLEAIRSDARRLAVDTDAVGALWEGETPDDFEPIVGIGKVFEQRLYDAGIRSYRTLAAATVEELAAICQAHTAVAPDFAAWIEQAKILNIARMTS